MKRYILEVHEIDDSDPDNPVPIEDGQCWFQFDETFDKATIFEWLDELALRHICKK